jgi:hypothetical protein
MADTHAKHGPSYMAIFWYLAVLTVVEIGVIYLPISKVAIGALLVMVLLPDSLSSPRQTADSKKVEAPKH